MLLELNTLYALLNPSQIKFSIPNLFKGCRITPSFLHIHVCGVVSTQTSCESNPSIAEKTNPNRAEIKDLTCQPCCASG